MQKVNAHSLEKALSLLLEDEQNLMQSIIRAHEETCDYTNEKVQPLLETARSRPIYAQCPQMSKQKNKFISYIFDPRTCVNIILIMMMMKILYLSFAYHTCIIYIYRKHPE
ncbi:hypothetical protein BLA29_010446 [Euroglyphus maynei]|uniref:Uncharacterized protein n=1 Tax=Euroglyphus maynei TaxID=6958 RepID=A0A1Y3ATM8_EURMA|nr:hypothetical protein BLA29_010446 [Euroglyphus maynei]